MNSAKTNKNLVAADSVSDTKTITIWRKRLQKYLNFGWTVDFEKSYVYVLRMVSRLVEVHLFQMFTKKRLEWRSNQNTLFKTKKIFQICRIWLHTAKAVWEICDEFFFLSKTLLDEMKMQTSMQNKARKEKNVAK